VKARGSDYFDRTRGLESGSIGVHRVRQAKPG
jgi:hypothetical protein